jgi:DNA repair exonuclease SbcCD ATPase subunit
MIRFEKIRYKNFLSTGNQFTEISFTSAQTTLIVGNNGAGKSTILDALTFALFGKSFRGVNKPQLVNSVNEKDCVVEVEFLVGNTQWKIIRGIKPSIFELYRNGVILNQDAASVDQQKWFEQTVLKMNYKSFTQIVILGSSSFVPFMQLSASHRREVIEDLLDIKIFSSMNVIIKEKIKEFKDEIKTLELKKESLNDKVQMQQNFIDELANRGNQNIKDKQVSILSLNQEQEYLINQNSATEENIFELQKELEKVSGASAKLKKLGTLKGKLSQKVSTITEEYKFFTENTACPTCTQTIEEEFRMNRISDAKLKAKELQKGFEELGNTIKFEEEREHQFSSLSKEIVRLNHEISQNNTRVSLNQRQVLDLEKQIKIIEEQLKNQNTEHEKLDNFKEQLETSDSESASKKETIGYYDFVYGLLKDGGVKTKIIKKYLPLINQQVNRYLQMMDFYINFSLDEEFNESIKSPIHEDFSYSSFSEGERMRIDLALLFTWREVAKIKNSLNCNIIIFDETFDSSLDGFGIDEFMKIIRFVIKDANIFVISHKEGMRDKFIDVLKFEKIKGFSKVSS